MNERQDIPDEAIRKIGYIIRDAKQATLLIIFGLILFFVGIFVPVIGLVRLIQWRYYRDRYPQLMITPENESDFAATCMAFKRARTRYLAMVLINPFTVHVPIAVVISLILRSYGYA